MNESRNENTADNVLRIMIAAGGTGGHVYPAIAIADAIREEHPEARILFVGTRNRMEWKVVPAAGYDIAPIWISGFHRRLTLKNLFFPLKLIVSLWQSWKLIKKFRPHAMVSCGGFAAGPVGWMAAKLSVPLFLQEQNSFPGITNRKLADRAERIFIAFENASKWFPQGKTLCVGNPVRKALVLQTRDQDFIAKSMRYFGLDPSHPVVLVMGGSGGAKSINEAMMRHIMELHDDDGLQVIWQCGEYYLEDITKRLEEYGNGSGRSPEQEYDHSSVDAGPERPPEAVESRFPGLRLRGFMNDIAEAWAVADVIVSRAGATTCAELLTTGKAGILVPSPWVAGDHQTHNARALADKGAAILLKDEELNDRLPEEIRTLIGDPSRIQKIKQQAAGLAKYDAAEVIAKQILEHVRQVVQMRRSVVTVHPATMNLPVERQSPAQIRQNAQIDRETRSRQTAIAFRESPSTPFESHYTTATA